MITKNYKKILSGELVTVPVSGSAGGTAYPTWRYARISGIPIYDIAGMRCYAYPNGAAELADTNNFNLSLVTNGASMVGYSGSSMSEVKGVVIGLDGTAESEDDFQLHSRYLPDTNHQYVLTDVKQILDEVRGIGYRFKITVTNTSNEDFTIREIGYQAVVQTQRVPGQYRHSPEMNSTSQIMYSVILVDRTVLSQPVTISSDESAVLVYELFSRSEPAKPSVQGVNIVSWENGSDADVAAMIDAAHQGLIDLREDGGWQLGDVRVIDIPAFTDSNNTSHVAQKVGIAISSFKNYNNCGNMLQFDFLNSLYEYNAASSGQYVKGYNNSYIYSKLLPSLVDVLPEWLKSRLITFDVKAGRWDNGEVVFDTIQNNKLAIRAVNEVTNYDLSQCYSSEGELVDLFGRCVTYCIKDHNFIYSSSTSFMTRTPYSASAPFTLVRGYNTVAVAYGNSNVYVAPFGCL